MSGILVDEIRYFKLMNNNEFKNKSLEDNVYFTLRDIFANAESADTFMEANNFSSRLTNNICFEDRIESFHYSNELHQRYYVESLRNWLKHFDIHYFEFKELEKDEEFDMNKYIKWEDWWVQFEELRNLIDIQYEKCCKWEKEDIDRDMEELSDNND